MTDAQHYDVIVVGTGSSEELEPYYTQAEHLYLVHGRHGEDPTEDPTSAQYAYPPVQHEPRMLLRSANDRHPRGPANSSDPLGGIHLALDENNPSLTAIANAPRVGDRIADRLR